MLRRRTSGVTGSPGKPAALPGRARARRAGLEPGLQARQRARAHGQLDLTSRGRAHHHDVPAVERVLLGAARLALGDEGQVVAPPRPRGARKRREDAEPLEGVLAVATQPQHPALAVGLVRVTDTELEGAAV